MSPPRPMIVRVCADLYSDKVNLEFPFTTPPSIPDFCAQCIAVFSAEADLMRPPNSPRIPFQIYRVQVFDDKTCQWAELTSPSQLYDGAQVYVFQPQTSVHSDVSKPLPPPRPPSVSQPHYHHSAPHHTSISPARAPESTRTPTFAQRPAASPQRHPAYTAARMEWSGREATDEEKLRYVFEEIDVTEQGAFRFVHFQQWVRQLVSELTDSQLQELFANADTNRDGV
eukprot:Sspe_Gene.63100::Locus_35864_Transcript_1_1_Confidence_1.000_Length_730::g.63100::m.63100